MANQRKHTPNDSAQEDPGHDQSVVSKKTAGKPGREAKTSDPAKKREHSEQPTTKHNSKT